MLPMVLKRYEAEAPSPRTATGAGAGGVAGGGAAKKSRRKVIVPHRLDCSRFMAPTGEMVRVKGCDVLIYRFILLNTTFDILCTITVRHRECICCI